MSSSIPKSLRDFQPQTPEGKRMKEATIRFLRKIRTKEDAFEVMKSIGLYNEDGTPNPYFYPDAADKGEE